MKSLERSFMFNTGFQSCSAMALTMECAVSGLTAHPDFLEELRNEVDGQASTLITFKSGVLRNLCDLG